MTTEDRILKALRDLNLHGGKTHGGRDSRYLALYRELKRAKGLPWRFTWLSPRATR